MKKRKVDKFDVKKLFWGFKHGLFSKFTMTEIQILAADNMNETSEVLKPMVSLSLTEAGFYMLYLFLLLHLSSKLLD